MSTEQRASYHHGDLRRVLLDHAQQVIAENGVGDLSLRALARRAGVSHAAPAHHFLDRAGLLTALATEGFAQLADLLESTHEHSESFLEVGIAYIRFARTRPAHFAVMFQPTLYNAEDAEVAAARARASAVLYAGAREMPGVADGGPAGTDVGVAAWSMVHGFATLWAAGALPERSPEEQARHAISALLGE